MAPLRARQGYVLLSRLLVSAVIFFGLAPWGWAICVSAQAAPPTAIEASAATAAQPLYLDVSINSHPTNKIAAFLRHPDGRFSATRAELEELTIAPGGKGAGEEQVFLDDIKTLSFTYDEPSQKLLIRLKAAALQHNAYRASADEAAGKNAQVTTGAVLNYGLYGSINEHELSVRHIYEGATLSLDGRVFGTYGTLESSVITGFSDFDSRRIDTSWSYSFADSLVTVRAGDFVSGGFGWSRPVRMAGFKIERNFDLRPDLITKPLPTVSGSAAVPSTVDVYVNNIKTYSKDVPSGPFSIAALPVVSGGGVTRLVVRDATGRETVTETPFYSASNLLREGLWDYSAEVGFARLNYGSRSNDYAPKPIVSGSVRYGVSDTLTVAWHGEAGAGVGNAGAALATRVGLFGTGEFGLSLSRHGGDTGGQLFAAFQGDFDWFTVSARTQRSFADYTDVAAHTFDNRDLGAHSFGLSLAPARAVDFVSLGIPVEATGSNLNLSYVHTERADGDSYDIASLSYSQSLTEAISMHATAFKSFSDADGVGVYLGLSMSLGDRRSVSSSVRHDASGSRFFGSYAKSADTKPGNLGWRVYVSGGEHDVVRADVDYNAAKVVLRGSLARDDHGVAGSFSADGAVAVTADGMFLSRRIDDAFAVVDVGAPNVEVRVENRVVGETDSSGKLLVTGLHAYQRNKITIDPNALPVNARIPTTRMDAVPADRSGMAVRFDVEAAPQSALVEFRNADGGLIAAGHAGKLLATGGGFVIGYDGQAFIEGLSAANTVEIALSEGTCRATFPFRADPGAQVLIDGVTCR